jgi:hypothetical protein
MRRLGKTEQADDEQLREDEHRKADVSPLLGEQL